MPSLAARKTMRPSPDPKSTNFSDDDDDDCCCFRSVLLLLLLVLLTCCLIKSNMIFSLFEKVGRYGAPRRCSTGGRLRMMARCGKRKRVPPIPRRILLLVDDDGMSVLVFQKDFLPSTGSIIVGELDDETSFAFVLISTASFLFCDSCTRCSNPKDSNTLASSSAIESVFLQPLSCLSIAIV